LAGGGWRRSSASTSAAGIASPLTTAAGRGVATWAANGLETATSNTPQHRFREDMTVSFFFNSCFDPSLFLISWTNAASHNEFLAA